VSYAIDLTGKVALVTGASRGIGAACATALSAAGASVFVNTRGGDSAGSDLVEALNAAGGSAELLTFDVSDPAGIKVAFAQVQEKHGRLDVLVNNAGRRADALALRMTDEQWRDSMAVNLDGVFYCSREALALMRSGGGSIVNVSSAAAFAGSVGQANYAAAKAGVIGLTRTLAIEYGGRGIRVNCVVPGLIDTAMTEDLKPAYREQMIAQIPLKRFGRPEEIAATVVFLASDAASYVSGATLHVNGAGYPS
jgi:3-oxoacyl-[acyl-carrier protein] reductase